MSENANNMPSIGADIRILIGRLMSVTARVDAEYADARALMARSDDDDLWIAQRVSQTTTARACLALAHARLLDAADDCERREP